jgi:hypothetical protein
MPFKYKVLGQSAPAANTTSNVYTVPAATETVISSIVIVNRNNNANTTYRLAVQPAGAALANQHYLAYDAPVNALDSVILTLGATLGNTDVVSVYSANANMSFTVFGSEITA